jgi:hypothetical protein
MTLQSKIIKQDWLYCECCNRDFFFGPWCPDCGSDNLGVFKKVSVIYVREPVWWNPFSWIWRFDKPVPGESEGANE